MTDQPNQIPPKPEMLEISRTNVEALKNVVAQLAMAPYQAVFQMLDRLEPVKDEEGTP